MPVSGAGGTLWPRRWTPEPSTAWAQVLSSLLCGCQRWPRRSASGPARCCCPCWLHMLTCCCPSGMHQFAGAARLELLGSLIPERLACDDPGGSIPGTSQVPTRLRPHAQPGLIAGLAQVALRHWNSHALVNVAVLLGKGAPHRSLCSSAIIAVGLPAVVSPHAGVPCRVTNMPPHSCFALMTAGQFKACIIASPWERHQHAETAPSHPNPYAICSSHGLRCMQSLLPHLRSLGGRPPQAIPVKPPTCRQLRRGEGCVAPGACTQR